MHRSTRISRTMAAAMAVVALAVAGTAGSASAAPIDPVAALNAGAVGYGSSWSGGLARGNATLDWNNPLGTNSTTPRLIAPGNLYIENAAGLQARMQIVHYTDATETTVIATRDGGTKTGTGAFLDVFPIVLGGVASTSPHVRINLQTRGALGWTTVATGTEDL
jgi:hypothetical protein